MGRKLMTQAWMVPRRRLPAAAARLLLARMAYMAKDSEEQPAYFGGWDTLALCLGYEKFDHAADLAVGRAVRQLIESGYIKPDGYASGGNRRYRIEL